MRLRDSMKLMTRLRLIQFVTVIYALFIVGVVLSAGMGWNQSAFAWVRGFAGDKVLHFVLVGTLALLLNLSLQSQVMRLGPIGLQGGTMIMLVVATIEETFQLLVQNRTFDVVDLSCNYLGIIMLGSLARFLGRD